MLNQLNNPLAANQVTQQNSQINPSLGGNQQPGFPGSNTGVNQVKNPANQMRPTNQMMMVMNQNQPGMNMGGQMGATNVNNPMVNNQLFNQQQANNMGKYCWSVSVLIIIRPRSHFWPISKIPRGPASLIYL